MSDVYEMKPEVDLKKIKQYSIVIIFVVAILVLITAGNPIAIIDAGERGVVFSRITGVKATVMEEGLNFKMPFVESVVKYDVRTQKLERKFEAASKDLQSVEVRTVVNYHLETAMVSKIHQEIGTDYERKIILPAVEEAVKIGVAQFPVEKIIVEREKLKGIVTELLKIEMVKDNIIVENVNLVNIDLSAEFNKIVELKQMEEQKIKTAEYKKKQAQQEKEMVILHAEAQATKQKLLRQSVNKDIIALKWIEKWDGTLPQTMLGEGSVPMIDIRGK